MANRDLQWQFYTREIRTPLASEVWGIIQGKQIFKSQQHETNHFFQKVFIGPVSLSEIWSISQKIFIGPESLSEIWSILGTRKKLFSQDSENSSFFEELENSFPLKVSGNCSHTFSLLLASKNSLFVLRVFFFIFFSSNFLYFCAAIPVERLLCFGYLHMSGRVWGDPRGFPMEEPQWKIFQPRPLV